MFGQVVNSVLRRAPARVRVREATHPRCGSLRAPAARRRGPGGDQPHRGSGALHRAQQAAPCLALRDRRWEATRRAYPPDLGGYPSAGATCAPAHIWPARGGPGTVGACITICRPSPRFMAPTGAAGLIDPAEGAAAISSRVVVCATQRLTRDIRRICTCGGRETSQNRAARNRRYVAVRPATATAWSLPTVMTLPWRCACRLRESPARTRPGWPSSNAAAGSVFCDPATSPGGGCCMISLDRKIFDPVSRLTASGGTT
jgi:hypothetical protein